MDTWMNRLGDNTRVSGYLNLVPRLLRQFRPMADLTDQVALITGGSRGLGLLLAKELANAGCKLAICARDEAELARAKAILTEHGSRERGSAAAPASTPAGTPPRAVEVLTLYCDVTDRDQIQRMVDEVQGHYGRIDILVNNAGIMQVEPLENTTRADVESAMDVMFWGLHDVTMAVLPKMLEHGYGRIVNVSSLGGKISVPHLLPYCTAKFAATGFSEGLRPSLISKNVTVTTVIPGLMRTGSIMNVLVKGDKKREVRWFSLLASMPVISMDADRAARQIVTAVRHGKAERVLGLPAKLAVRGHAMFPNVSAAILSGVSRVLPAPVMAEGMEPTASHDVDGAFDSPTMRRLTILSRKAAERNNEVSGSTTSNGGPRREDWAL
jgi:NAD(P)-dependent dehydrogenase (short-subunit alcohol dehydrogenase family)